MTHDSMPDEIWISDIEGSRCRCWNGPTYGGFHGEGHKSTKYTRTDIFNEALDIIEHFLQQGDFSDPHWLGKQARAILARHRPDVDPDLPLPEKPRLKKLLTEPSVLVAPSAGMPDEIWVGRTIGGVTFPGSQHRMPGDVLYRRADIVSEREKKLMEAVRELSQSIIGYWTTSNDCLMFKEDAEKHADTIRECE